MKANAAHISGTFVDANGRPISGVEFISRVYPGAEFPTTSSADGRFESRVEWDAKKEGTWYEGIARGFGYAKWQTRADLKANDKVDLGKIKLDPGGAVSGRVLDHTGKPLADAFLRVVDAAHSPRPDVFEKKAGRDQVETFDSGSTKDDGTFRLVGLPSGRYWIIAKHETTWRDATELVEVSAGKDVPVAELRLDPLPDEYRIEGTVLGPDEKPVSRAEVSTPEGRATTNGQGRFALYLSQLPDGPLDLRARVGDDRFDETFLNNVRPGSRDLVVRLGAMRELHMLVLGPSGKPVENFGWFVGVDKGEISSHSGVFPDTHPSGRATIRVPDFPIEIEVDAPGFNRKTLEKLGTGTLPEIVEVRLDSPAGVDGSVVYSGGPVFDCYVELVAADPDHLNGVLGEQRSGLFYGWKGTNTRSDALGHFLIPSDFPHMTYYVRAWKEGYAEGIAGPTKVGGGPVIVELGEGGSIEGDTQLPQGKSPASIVAEMYRKERKSTGDLEDHVGTEFSAPVGEDGKFRIEHLAPGPWLLRLKVPGTLASDLGWSTERVDEYAKIPRVIKIEKGVTTHSTLDLTSDDVCRLEGHLHVGNMIQEGYCTLELDGSLALRASFGGIDRSGDKGFRLATRTPGRYRLVIQAGPGHHQYKTITDLVDLKPGLNTWEKDLPESQWNGKGIRLDAH